MDDSNNRRCSRCGKVFKSRHSLAQHINAKHKGAGKRTAVHQDREPSIADMMVDAEISRAMGEPVEDWLVEMLPDD